MVLSHIALTYVSALELVAQTVSAVCPVWPDGEAMRVQHRAAPIRSHL